MVLLISIKTLKDSYLIDDNMDDKYLLPVIVKGQDFIIRAIIGKDKFNELLDSISNNNLSLEDKDLLDKIEPILAYYVMSEVVYSTAYKLKNKGLEDSSDTNRFNELVKISKKYLIDSQHYEQLLIDTFCQKKSVYKTGLNI